MQECVSTEISYQFACGENEAGSLRIAVLKAGYTGEEKLIDVTMGPRHATPKHLRFAYWRMNEVAIETMDSVALMTTRFV